MAGCVEALSRDRALLLAFWTVHRPPSPTALALALRLLHALAAAPPAAWCAAAQGGSVYLLTALLPVTPAAAHDAVSPVFNQSDLKSPVTCHFEHVSGVLSSWSDSLPSDCHSTRLTLSCFLLVYGSTRFSECTSSHGCLL